MKLRTYHAYTMADALAAVRKDLGVGALILHTRSFKRGGIFGLGRQTIIEVTATPAAPPDLPKPAATVPRLKLKTTQAQRAYAKRPATAIAGIPSSRVGGATNNAATVEDDDQSRTRRLAMALDEARRRRAGGGSAVAAAVEKVPQNNERNRAPVPSRLGAVEQAPARPQAAAVSGSAGPSVPLVPLPSVTPSARRFLLMMPDKPAAAAPVPAAPIASAVVEAPSTALAQSSAAGARPIPPAPNPIVVSIAAPAEGGVGKSAPESADGADHTDQNGISQHQALTVPSATSVKGPALTMQDELTAIKQMVGQVLQRQVVGGQASPAMPRQLFDFYLRLIGQDISDELADQIVNAVRDELSVAELEHESTLRAAVMKQLAAFIPVAAEPISQHALNGRPLTIALVGPTGVGKTTTLAKLAATFKLQQGKKVGLITADSYRIAAVDQLRTYAEIIGLPMEVALTPGEMKHAINAMRDRDVILIDTAGRSQNDAGRLVELRRMISAADPHEVHLVLSSTAGEKVLLQQANAFAHVGGVGVHKIVLTKLDEAVSFGVLVNVIRKIGKQLSFITTGQEVPEHFETGRAERLAELVLGGSLHS